MLEVMPNRLPEPAFLVGYFFVGDNMDSFKYLGILEPSIADVWGLEEHKNKPILVYEDRIDHVITRHLRDFGSKEEIIKVYNSLDTIIKKPDLTFYNEKNKSLEFYKNLNSDVCVAVRINYGKVLKVRSWYPVKKNKMINREKKGEEKILEQDS